MVWMKFIDNSKLLNGLIDNKLIQYLYKNLSNPY